MLHEARDRQKFISDVQYLRDMQHKVDSEYQACLRRQECKKDPNEKKQDQLWGKDTNERSRFSRGSSSKMSSGEEDSLSETRSSTKVPTVKCEHRLPAIDQTSVKQKYKSTMTPKKPEKGSPGKPSTPAAHAPKILSRKRRPNLGRLTVSPEMHGSRVPGEKSRQKSQLPAKAPVLLGADPVVQQEGLMCSSESKLKRPAPERSLASATQLMRTAGKPLERAKKGDPSAGSQKEPHTSLSQPFQAVTGPQVLSESLGRPLLPTTVGGPRRMPFRFHDKDFYSAISLNSGQENYDTDEETHMEEELLLVGMHSPHSPLNHKRSRFTRTSATPNRNAEKNAENDRSNSLRRSESNLGSLRRNNSTESVTKQPSVRQRMLQDSRLPAEPAKDNDSRDKESEKTAHSGDAKPDDVIVQDDVSTEDSSDCSPLEDRPDAHDYDRDWQNYLNGSRNSFDCLVSGRPTAPRPSMNSSYNTPGSLLRSAMTDDIPTDLSMSSILVPRSDLEENLRFNTRRPLSPIGNRNLLADAESHNEFAIRETEDMASRSQPQGTLLLAEDLLARPHSSLTSGNSPSSSPRRNVQGHLYVPGSLQENRPFTFFAVSDIPNQSDNGTRIRVSRVVDEKGAAMKADPEKLRKLQESLLEEDSEEEGDLCRICQIAGGSPTNPLLEPCGCVGSLLFVHQECLKKWLKVKITSGADLGTVKTCEMCKQGLLVDLDDFNMTEFYHKHQQSRAQNELMNSGLYLVLLLHLYEQRFAELMTLNLRRASRERVLSPEMATKAAFIQTGSSSRGAGGGVQPRPLHPEALSVPHPHASLPPSSLLTLKPMFHSYHSHLCYSPLGSGLSIHEQPWGPNLIPASTGETAWGC